MHIYISIVKIPCYLHPPNLYIALLSLKVQTQKEFICLYVTLVLEWKLHFLFGALVTNGHLMLLPIQTCFALLFSIIQLTKTKRISFNCYLLVCWFRVLSYHFLEHDQKSFRCNCILSRFGHVMHPHLFLVTIGF